MSLPTLDHDAVASRLEKIRTDAERQAVIHRLTFFLARFDDLLTVLREQAGQPMKPEPKARAQGQLKSLLEGLKTEIDGLNNRKGKLNTYERESLSPALQDAAAFLLVSPKSNRDFAWKSKLQASRFDIGDMLYRLEHPSVR